MALYDIAGARQAGFRDMLSNFMDFALGMKQLEARRQYYDWLKQKQQEALELEKTDQLARQAFMDWIKENFPQLASGGFGITGMTITPSGPSIRLGSTLPKPSKITASDIKQAEKNLAPTLGQRFMGLLQNLIPGAQPTERKIRENEKVLENLRQRYIQQFFPQNLSNFGVNNLDPLGIR